MNPNKGKGAIRVKPHKQDYQWSEIGFGAKPFDWTTGYDVEKDTGLTLRVKDQGESYSCGGQAFSYYGEVLNKVFDGTPEERSAKAIYSQCFYPNGGSDIYGLTKVVKDFGWALESLVPSYPATEVNLRRFSDISEEAKKQAANDRAFSYAFVDRQDIDAIAQAIQLNKGAIIGIAGSNNGTWLSTYPKPPITTTDTWNHWVYAGKAKVIDGVRHIGVLNSWGGNCGTNGWQWISEDYLRQGWCWVVATLVYNTQPIDHSFRYNFTKDLYYGNSGKEVEALQRALQLDGCFPTTVPCTGFYGNTTRIAVKTFLTKYAITNWFIINVTNKGEYVGRLTRAKLNELFNK